MNESAHRGFQLALNNYALNFAVKNGGFYPLFLLSLFIIFNTFKQTKSTFKILFVYLYNIKPPQGPSIGPGGFNLSMMNAMNNFGEQLNFEGLMQLILTFRYPDGFKTGIDKYRLVSMSSNWYRSTESSLRVDFNRLAADGVEEKCGKTLVGDAGNYGC